MVEMVVKTHMLVVENTHDKIVGTVHLVKNENVFVAKSSLFCALSSTNTASGPLTGIQQHLIAQEDDDTRKLLEPMVFFTV